MSPRVVYTGTRRPPGVAGVDVIHIPALLTQCLNPDLSTLPTEPCFAVFFSQNAVDCAVELCVFDLLSLEGVVAVGEATASSIRSVVGVPVYTPSSYTFEGVLELMASPMFHADKPICSFELKDGPHTLAGVFDRVVSIPIYATGVVDREGFDLAIHAASADWIVFASPRAVALWASTAHSRTSHLVASIGSTTTQALRDVGVEPDLVPELPGLDALLTLIASA